MSHHDQGFQTEAVVKWFNLTKGFGFVAPADGTSDAFMHSSVVSRAGLRDVPEGTKLKVSITDGPKGRQVASIIEVMGMSEIPQSNHSSSNSGHGSFGQHGGAQNDSYNGGFNGSQGFGGGHDSFAPMTNEPDAELTGIVKWFKPEKGFGFVTPDDGGRDVFVHRTVILRAGLQFLDSGQKVKMHVQTASKGREATSIELLG
jgi:CspA family cold shock protein